MTIEFECKRRVQFAETDMAGLVHFSNFFRYMEEAEYEFLRSLGLNVVMDDDRGKFGFPRLLANCEYLKPAVYDDELSIKVSVVANDGKSIEYKFVVRRTSCAEPEKSDEANTSSDELLARGHFKVACCRFPGHKLPYAIPIPDVVLKKIPETS